MVTRDVQNKLVITSTPVKEWYQLFQKLPFSLNTLRYLIFGKNIITSYFKAKLVLATPARGFIYCRTLHLCTYYIFLALKIVNLNYI